MSVNTLKRYGRILDSICYRMIKRAGGHGYLWLKSGIMMDNKSIGYYMRYDLKFNVPDITLDDLVCIEIKDRIWVAVPLDRMNKKKIVEVEDFSDSGVRQRFAWELSHDLANKIRKPLTRDLIAQSPYIANKAQNLSGFRGTAQDWTELDKTQAMQNFYKEYDRLSAYVMENAGFIQSSWIDWKSFKCDSAIPLIVYIPEKGIISGYKNALGVSSDRLSYTWEIDIWSGQWQLCEEFVKAIEL